MGHDREETLLTVFDVLLDELKTSVNRDDVLSCLERLIEDFPTIEFSSIPGEE